MINIQNYYEEIRAIRNTQSDYNEKSVQLKQLLERLCKEITQNEGMQFSTLFSRIVYIAQKYKLTKHTEWKLQNFRVKVIEWKKHNISIDEKTYHQSERAILDLCQVLSDNTLNTASDEIEDDEFKISEPDENKENNNDTSTFTENEYLRVQILSIDKENYTLQCAIEKDPTRIVTVRYNVKSINDSYNSSVELFQNNAQLNLIDYSIDENGYLVPKNIVLEPDYLIDASAIALCFNNFSVSHLNYFMNKFQMMENRSYLLLGNLANYFLDELIFADNPETLTFDKVFLESFKQSPFEYATCEDIMSDDDFRKFMERAKEQFHNIKRVITTDFPQQDIFPHKSSLEPSFFSEKYGFQGRLDLLQKSNKEVPYKIVELKSGRLPYPSSNTGKITPSHEVQTAIYRLMIESVYNQSSRNIDAYILYSAGIHPGQNLRFAAIYQNLEKEILNLRNLIVSNELAISQGTIRDVHAQFASLRTMIDPSERVPDFFIQKIKKIEDTLIQCTPIERAYFYRFVQFISKELYLQKIGNIAHESPVGVAALWNSQFWDRAEALDLLYDLTIQSMDDNADDMKIVFKRNAQQNDLVNFREGDICIVYPRNNEEDNVLNNQILKGVISTITASEVMIRFRYKQRNKKHFTQNARWAIEHDTLDTSYNSMYKSLFIFLNAAKEKRSRLLGITPPRTQEAKLNKSAQYTDSVIEKAMSAQDYFLIIGPPGTGKTSVFARRLIEQYHSDKSKNILVLAYTNRAVNELCEAVHAALEDKNGECNQYIRIGTELSCDNAYRHRLLQNISANSNSRADLLQEMNRTRIFISTLSSINGRQELFNLKDFDVAIIDEASQILEPQLMGVLSRVRKFILIGDHNQLATIVLQNEYSSSVREQSLVDIGIEDCRISFFERLLQTCKNNNWDHAYAQLIHQGRMHSDIATFPSKFFYQNNLFPILDWQTLPLTFNENNTNKIDKCIAGNRMMLFSTEELTENSSATKINLNEANTIVSLVQSILRVYHQNQTPIDTSQIGIIAPYRNQIALIKQQLALAEVKDYEQISIDTVERYQGSQRTIILLSFCVNKPYQLDFLCNLNSDGTVDRKLNVALTRAREQLFMVGNANILRRHPIYAQLLDFMKEKTIILKE